MKNIIPLLLICFLFSCTSENEEDLFPPDAPIPANQKVSFSTDVKPILTGNCTFSGCHSGGAQSAPGNWNNYIDVKARVDNGKFNIKVLDPGYTMPRGDTGALAPSKRAILRRWVTEGAKNN
jgi:hypothetical protein